MTIITGNFSQFTPFPDAQEENGVPLQDKLSLRLDAAGLTCDAQHILAELLEAQRLEDHERTRAALYCLRVVELIARLLPYKEQCPY